MKVLSIFVVGVLLLGGIGAVVASGIIDQHQELENGYIPIGCSDMKTVHNYTAAQSFIPQKEVLTRIELNMSRMPSTTYSCYVAIRENLTDTDNLVEIGLVPDNFSIYDGDMNLTWTEFDFEDLQVTVDETYYIVVYSSNASGNFYLWGGHGGRDVSPYPNGTMFRSDDGGEIWQEYIMSDACFRTYGRNDSSPTVKIENPAKGYLHILGMPMVPILSIIADAIAFGGFRTLAPVIINATDDFDSNEDLNISIYVDDVLVENATTTYCSDCGVHKWQWAGQITGFKTLRVTAKDSCGNIGSSEELKVFYICLM